MTTNNNLSVLPFYTSLDQQNREKSYAFGDIFPLLSPRDRMLPFQFTTGNSGVSISQVYLHNLDGSLVLTMGPQMKSTGLSVIPTRFGDNIYYHGLIGLNTILPLGYHYLQIVTTKGIYYSDIFSITPGISSVMKIQWWDDQNLAYEGGEIVYDGAFKNTLYLCTELGKPEYSFEEEGEKRDGFFFAEKQLSEKTYRFITTGPEYLCDAMRIIRLSDNILIEFKGLVYPCDSFQITVKWLTQGNLASIEAEFQTNTIIKKIARAFPKSTVGDFNKDFNTDFNT